jgi:hypothetical protein
MMAKPPVSHLNAAIGRAAGFLHDRQLPSGELTCFMSTDPTLATDRRPDSSPFPTALIAYSLGFVDSPLARRTIERATRFLVAQMEGPGMWRYWTREHEHHSVIPADLDDVACVSYVLRREGVPFPANEELLLANRDARGRFHTWIVPRLPAPLDPRWWRVALWQWARPARAYHFWKLNECERGDVDGIVNANVLLYLGETQHTRAVVPYLAEILESGTEESCDKWHLNRFTFYYAVARAFREGAPSLAPLRGEIVRRIAERARPDGAIGGTELDTALAACALLAWGEAAPELDRAIEYLLARQMERGEWPATAMYYGGPRKYYGWGSEELTTGFCIEALARYRSACVDGRAP